ncbi:MAG: RHS repeat-associated core domain-containing protein [Flavobacteriaceae bacterium]|nr:RHS repeat-associated core domain-containing protein [Flavobacteriaceae bacterium]
MFDAWGEVVKLTDGSNNNLSSFTLLDRGYTGHEHLLGVGLVHMNGRLYDPKLHRFLMPDNFVQDPYNTQNFNRYGYVLNNPLSYTDPSGELSFKQFVGFVITLAAVFLAAVVAYAVVFTSVWVGIGVASLLGTTVGITTGAITFSVLTYSAIVAFDFIGRNLTSFVNKINDPEQQRYAFASEQSYFGITIGVKSKYFNENFIIQNTPEFSLSTISKK